MAEEIQIQGYLDSLGEDDPEIGKQLLAGRKQILAQVREIDSNHQNKIEDGSTNYGKDQEKITSLKENISNKNAVIQEKSPIIAEIHKKQEDLNNIFIPLQTRKELF